MVCQHNRQFIGAGVFVLGVVEGLRGGWFMRNDEVMA